MSHYDQEPWMKVLHDNVNRARTGFPFIIHFNGYLSIEIEKECNEWIAMQGMPVVADSIQGKLYRFANREDATLFKMAFGGEFIEDNS